MKKRQIYIVANWKMNPETLDEGKKIYRGIMKRRHKITRAKLVFAPPTLYLQQLVAQNRDKYVEFGAQDVSIQNGGSYTGEVGATMLRKAGARYCIVGHSERRAMGESDRVIAEKMKIALENGLTPILCVGERVRDGEGEYLEYITNQLRLGISLIDKKHLLSYIIAYEPVWAIGKHASEAPSSNDVYEAHLFIRKMLGEIVGPEMSAQIPVLYGGAVELENAKEIMDVSGVSGFLVGHFSLVANGFGDLLNQFK